MTQINQARLFSALGFHEVAVILLRRHVEQVMRKLVWSSDKPGKRTRKKIVYRCAGVLIKRNVISNQTAKSIEKVYSLASSVVHGDPATRQLFKNLLSIWQTIRLPPSH